VPSGGRSPKIGPQPSSGGRRGEYRKGGYILIIETEERLDCELTIRLL
jgi:hypothetical protein